MGNWHQEAYSCSLSSIKDLQRLSLRVEDELLESFSSLGGEKHEMLPTYLEWPQPTSGGLQPNSDGLQATRDGLQPNGLQPSI